MIEIITKNKLNFIINFSQKDTSDLNCSKILHAISVADSLLNEFDKENSISKGIGILSEIIESNVSNNSKNINTIIFGKCIECFSKTTNQIKCILNFFFKKYQEIFQKLFINKKTTQDLSFQVYASHSLTRFYYLELIKTLPNLILNKLELICSLIDLLTKDNSLIEERLLILDILEDNIIKDSNMNKIFLENFNFLLSNYINNGYAKEEKAKLFFKSFKILSKILDDKNDFSSEVLLVLKDFFKEFLFKDEINYKIFSYALIVANKAKSNFEFLVEILIDMNFCLKNSKLDSIIPKNLGRSNLENAIKNNTNEVKIGNNFFAFLIEFYIETSNKIEFNSYKFEKIMLKMIYAFLDFLYNLDFSHENNIEILIQFLINFEEINNLFKSLTNKDNSVFELIPNEKFYLFKIFNLMSLTNIKEINGGFNSRVLLSDQLLSIDNPKSQILIKEFYFSDLLKSNKEDSSIRIGDNLTNHKVAFLSKVNNYNNYAIQGLNGIDDLKEIKDFLININKILNLTENNLSFHSKSDFESNLNSLFFIKLDKQNIIQKLNSFSRKVDQNQKLIFYLFQEENFENLFGACNKLLKNISFIIEKLSFLDNSKKTYPDFILENFCEIYITFLTNILYWFKIRLNFQIIENSKNLDDLSSSSSHLQNKNKQNKPFFFQKKFESQAFNDILNKSRLFLNQLKFFIKKNSERFLIVHSAVSSNFFDEIFKTLIEYDFLKELIVTIKLLLKKNNFSDLTIIKKFFDFILDIYFIQQEIFDKYDFKRKNTGLIKNELIESIKQIEIVDFVNIFSISKDNDTIDPNLSVYFSFLLFKKLIKTNYQVQFCKSNDINYKKHENHINLIINFLQNIERDSNINLNISKNFLCQLINYMENFNNLTKIIYDFINFKMDKKQLILNSKQLNQSNIFQEFHSLKNLNFIELDKTFDKINKLVLIKNQIQEHRFLFNNSEEIIEEPFPSNDKINNSELIKENYIDFLKHFLKIKKAFITLDVINSILFSSELNLFSSNNDYNETENKSTLQNNIFSEIKINIFNITKCFEKIFSNEINSCLLYLDKGLYEELLNFYLKICSILNIKNNDNIINIENDEVKSNSRISNNLILLKNYFLDKVAYFSEKVNEFILFIFKNVYCFEENPLFQIKINKKSLSEDENNYNIIIKNETINSKNSLKFKDKNNLIYNKIDSSNPKFNHSYSYLDIEDKSFKFYCFIYLDEKEYIKVNLNDETDKILSKKEINLKIKAFTETSNSNLQKNYQKSFPPEMKDLDCNHKFRIKAIFYVTFRNNLHIKLKSIEKLLD